MHRRLLFLTRNTRLPLTLTILTGVAAGLMAIAQSYALSHTVNDVFLRQQSLPQVWPWMEGLLAIAGGRTLLAWINEVAANRVAVGIKTDLRERLLAHILTLGPAYTRGERTGELIATAVDGVEALDAYFSQYLPQLVISTLVPITILILVFPLDPLSGIVLLLTAPLIPFFMYMIGRGAEAVTKRQYETLGRLSAHFLDSLQGLTTLKLFGQSKAQARNIEQVSNQYRDATLKVLQVTFLSAFALELLATISTAIIAVEVGLRLLYGQMQFQEALFLLVLAPEFYLPLRMLGLRFHAGMAGTSAARRIFGILDIHESNTPSHAPDGVNTTPPAQPSRPTFSSLELREVTYFYPGEEQPVLGNISFRIAAGQHLALVGASGAGKSTLASLLLRFMEPSSGSIALDGQLVSGMPIEQWREMIAWVPQNPHLFHDTLAANIRLGKPEASDEEIASAARAAHLENFIDSLPDRYGTVIGEAGARLSSGQAQRVALARAFLLDAPILIMDEPTSSLDPETEVLLEESTRRLMAGRTVITIAHRLNTVAGADRIIVLRDGHIAETGTHRDLMKAGGAYARTVRTQGEEPQMPPSRNGAPAAAEQDWEVVSPPDAPIHPAHASSESSGRPSHSVFTQLLSFLRGSWGWVSLSVVLGSLTIGASVALMGTSSWLISTAALRPSIAALEVAIVGVRFFGIARAVFRYLERLVSHNVTFRLLGRLRTWFYEKLEPLAPARLMGYRAGDLLARIIGDVNALENFYVRVLAPPATALLVCLGVGVFLAIIDPELAILLVACFLLLGMVLPLVVLAASRRVGSEAVLQRAELQVQMVDGIQGLPDLLAFGRARQWMQDTGLMSHQYRDSQQRLARINALHSAIFTCVTNLAPWLVLVFVIPSVAAGQMPGVMLAPLVLVMSSSFEAVAPLPLAAQMWTTSRAAASRLLEVIEAEPAVRTCAESSHPGPEPHSASRIGIEDLEFAYPGQLAPAVKGINLQLEPGKKVAIVGPSGAGKSTVAGLILRFWDFERGDILLDGRSIKAYDQDAVRAQIAVVYPNAYFFNTSVFENLRMARRGVLREEVEQAALAAQIHDTIVRLPMGYDTLIGEQGLRLSGGERQRLAIARAILKQAPILILDEPTANLDAENEAGVLETLFQCMEGKASLLITHRLIGLARMDEILVMEHGRIVERGSQAGLLKKNGFYHRLWDQQYRFLRAY